MERTSSLQAQRSLVREAQQALGASKKVAGISVGIKKPETAGQVKSGTPQL